jgi:hypothetical protein
MVTNRDPSALTPFKNPYIASTLTSRSGRSPSLQVHPNRTHPIAHPILTFVLGTPIHIRVPLRLVSHSGPRLSSSLNLASVSYPTQDLAYPPPSTSPPTPAPHMNQIPTYLACCGVVAEATPSPCAPSPPHSYVDGRRAEVVNVVGRV